MDRTRTTGTQPNRLERTLSHLKIVSRLLGHELHTQNAPRLSFSRDEIVESLEARHDYRPPAIRGSLDRTAPRPVYASMIPLGLSAGTV